MPSGERRCDELLTRLATLENPDNVAGMARFGITTAKAWGISMLVLREIAREAGRDRELAACLWRSGWHEARILASLVAEPQTFTGEEMEEWVREIDSWDLCDQCCSNLFSRTTLAWEKAMSWSGRDEEFVRRAGFALMAVLAVHDRSSPDERFCAFLPLIRTYSTDNRQMVKKAVNWGILLRMTKPLSRWMLLPVRCCANRYRTRWRRFPNANGRYWNCVLD